MVDVLETIHIALTGAKSLLKRISTGNIQENNGGSHGRYQHTILFFLIAALIRAINTLQAEEEKLFRKQAFIKATLILFLRYA